MIAAPTHTPRAATEHPYVLLEMQGRGSPHVHQSMTARAATEHPYVPLEMQGRDSPHVHHSLTPRAATEHPSVTWHRSEQGEPLHDVFGNKAITLPRQWPLARPHLATRSERRQRAELRMGFAWAMQKDQHDRGLSVWPPCSWCGHPTGGYCHFCDEQLDANAVCTSCQDTDAYAACRQCTLAMSSVEVLLQSNPTCVDACRRVRQRLC